MEFDELMMERCLTLAALGEGFTAPNPLVGAVLVHGDRIIGEGYHKRYGQPHAEVNAIQSVDEKDLHLIPSSILYVSLEPCNHVGKTPPCSDLIISSRIQKVVVGTIDTNKQVAGGGIDALRKKGIEVIKGVKEKECREINKFYFTSVEKQRPYITFKWAQSADGFIAGENGAPVHFTAGVADHLIHRWRAAHTSILVGGRTVINDNPRLTVRFWPGRNPMRVVINTKEEFASSLEVLNNEASTWIFNYSREGESGNLVYVLLDRGADIASQVVTKLHHLGVNSLLVEGGARTIDLFVKAGLWDEARVFISPKQLKVGIRAPELPGGIVSSEEISDLLLITSRPL